MSKSYIIIFAVTCRPTTGSTINVHFNDNRPKQPSTKYYGHFKVIFIPSRSESHFCTFTLGVAVYMYIIIVVTLHRPLPLQARRTLCIARKQIILIYCSKFKIKLNPHPQPLPVRKSFKTEGHTAIFYSYF